MRKGYREDFRVQFAAGVIMNHSFETTKGILMGRTAVKLKRDTERRVTWSRNSPITFTEYVDMAQPDEFYELVDGALEEMTLVQFDHEKLQIWLQTLLHLHVSRHDLGVVLGSRTPVEISEYCGRMPDILFVQKSRQHIVQQKAVYGPPDLVVELVSPNDRKAKLLARELDFRSIGVKEILFVHLPDQYVRYIQVRDEAYFVNESPSDPVILESLGGLRLEASWILKEPRPSVDSVLAR